MKNSLTIAAIFFGLNRLCFAAEGTFYRHIEADPTTLNPMTYTDHYADYVLGYVFDSLMTRDDNTWELIPALAEKGETSKDGMTYTFKLRDGVKWQDGQPLTADDVKYSFDVFFEGRFKAPEKALYFENIKEAKILDPKTVQFTAKEKYFKNFEVVAEMSIIPKHIYSVGNPDNPRFNREIIGTGPYMLDEWIKGQRLVLKRNPSFWGNNLPYYKDRFHFQRIFFRPVKEESVAIELLKKGDIDYEDMSLRPGQFVQKTTGPEWGMKVVAVKAENNSPENYRYGFIGWNNVHPLFKDRNVRMAMSYLINRDFMIQKFEFGLREKASGPFGNKSPSSSPKVKPIEFDPKKALALLQKSGWNLGPSGLIKSIDGKETPFEFTLLGANPDFERYLTVIKEDMKKVGITMNIKILEWNSFVKLLDERKFDAITMGWAPNTLEEDPKQIWHSSSIPSPGSNFVGYSNPKVDLLIDQLRKELNAKKRWKLYHQIHELIAEDQPYSFLFNMKYALYGATIRLKRPQDTLKYTVGFDTWSVK